MEFKWNTNNSNNSNNGKKANNNLYMRSSYNNFATNKTFDSNNLTSKYKFNNNSNSTSRTMSSIPSNFSKYNSRMNGDFDRLSQIRYSNTNSNNIRQKPKELNDDRRRRNINNENIRHNKINSNNSNIIINKNNKKTVLKPSRYEYDKQINITRSKDKISSNISNYSHNNNSSQLHKQLRLSSNSSMNATTDSTNVSKMKPSISNLTNRQSNISNISSNISYKVNESPFDLRLIRPSDKIVIYSSLKHCYVCLNDVEMEDDYYELEYNNKNINSILTNPKIKKINKHNINNNSNNNNNSNSLSDNNKSNRYNNGINKSYLKCDDMEGVAFIIDTLLDNKIQLNSGTCKYKQECKIQLITGENLSWNKDKKIVVEKHASKFMFSKKDCDDLSQYNSTIKVGDYVHIYVEATGKYRKQYWSINNDNILCLVQIDKPSINETFIIQKYGEPLKISDNLLDDYNNINNNNNYYKSLSNSFLDNASINIQEEYLCRDIIRILGSKANFYSDYFILQLNGNYEFPNIVFNNKKYNINNILISQVNAFLLIIRNTIHIKFFIKIHSRHEYGKVSQALCNGIINQLSDFNILLVQLESKLNNHTLSLQNLKYYLQRASNSLNALQILCKKIHYSKKPYIIDISNINKNSNFDPNLSFNSSLLKDLKSKREREHSNYENKNNIVATGNIGGSLLNILQEFIDKSGEKHVKLLYSALMKVACIPYFDMLSSWIYSGVINDIYGEFMISQKTHLKKENLVTGYNNDYWTRRYTLNKNQIPYILYDYKDIIVTTGKYFNVLRESNCPITYNPLLPNQNEIQMKNLELQFNDLNISNNSCLKRSKDSNSQISDNSDEIYSSNVDLNKSSQYFNSKTPSLNSSIDYTNDINNNNSINDINKNIKHKLHKCNPRELGVYIKDAYNFSSRALLNMLINRERIMYRFRSIRRFMLLGEGDWFNNFIDMTESILNNNASDIKIIKLNSLLELSIRTSVSKNDLFKDDICCDLKIHSLNNMIRILHDIKNNISINNYSNNINNNNSNNNNTLLSMSGFESFALDFKVKWPTSIVFTGKNLIRYQLIFRLLFELKLVERYLVNAWKYQMSLRELDLDNSHNNSLMLRQKMLSFINSLLFYIFYEVIEPNWYNFMSKIKKCNSIDKLLLIQEEFLRNTLQMCLLSKKINIDPLFNILKICKQYSNYVKRYSEDWDINNIIHTNNNNNNKNKRKRILDTYSKDCKENLLNKNFQSNIDKYCIKFEQFVKQFLDSLQTSHILSMNTLLQRLDFNCYYLPKHQNYQNNILRY